MKRQGAGESIELIAVNPQAPDPWEGISEDVIRRFVDVLCAQHSVPKEVLGTYRADLQALDQWLIDTKQRTLVSATDEDIREYINVSLACLRAFYGFLVNSGCRDDDPTEPDRPPRAKLALRRDREH